jgi:O-methyltransferase domain/Dimerisation domain
MKLKLPKTWTAEALLELGRSYQAAAVFAAAADLDLFDLLNGQALSAKEVARKLRCERRGVDVLLDALAALQLVRKRGSDYSLAPGTADLLTAKGKHSILAMAQHQANCLRNWAQLAQAVKTGRPSDKLPSVRGPEGDAASFIGAMNSVSAPIADEVIRPLRAFKFSHLLDVGGASGTWTIAFLRRCPPARATLFDLPHVIPMARRRLAAEHLEDRVKLVAGDFTSGPLPPGADLAWVSAIIHQNSPEQNRILFTRVFQALTPGGRIAIRDVLMEDSRIRPVAGALFAVNMLTATEGGGTFTFGEVRDDLQAAGFTKPTLLRRDDGMNSIVVAAKPVSAK